ncbi:hypothetical protein [Caulobacter sp. AP07]|uniref:hypothetical protein n=1 Tax=Caulobacter sp. AP07 TaxID=1144304 RepID=UPI0012FBFCDC|nr:hypothetical protein [Caulobacter sp. AP07]
MNLANSPRPAGDLAERLVFRQHETPCFDALRNLGLANRQVINGLYQKNCPSQKDFPALEGAAVAIDAETSRFAARSKDLARIIKPTDLRDAIYKASTDLGAVIRHEWPHEINKYCAFSIPEKMAYVDRITASSRAARQCEGALNAASRKVDPWG